MEPIAPAAAGPDEDGVHAVRAQVDAVRQREAVRVLRRFAPAPRGPVHLLHLAQLVPRAVLVQFGDFTPDPHFWGFFCTAKNQHLT